LDEREKLLSRTGKASGHEIEADWSAEGFGEDTQGQRFPRKGQPWRGREGEFRAVFSGSVLPSREAIVPGSDSKPGRKLFQRDINREDSISKERNLNSTRKGLYNTTWLATSRRVEEIPKE